jgi:NADP-dependent 3-hydroxy acid dehydrogenase YdfG/acyl carrier protein
VEAGEFTPLPHRAFSMDAVAAPFRVMSAGRHIGKIVITTESPAGDAHPRVRPDATYLITGGQGALGLATARWLAAEGARHIVLVSRSGRQAVADETAEQLEAMGLELRFATADVCREDELARVLADIDATMPPLAGVVHAAGVLADASVASLDRDSFAAAWKPKVVGAWNLHRLTAGRTLDFFVLYSSAASLLGTAGQANYAAANAFLDGLAQQRRAEGLPALSINWGPWRDIGLASVSANRGERLEVQGLGGLAPDDALGALSVALAGDAAQVAVMRLDARRWARAAGGDHTGLLAALLADGPTGAEARTSDTPFPAGLLAAPQAERSGLLEAHLRRRVAGVLRMNPERVQLGVQLKLQGMDSLMTLELRNALERDLGIPISAATIWNYSTVAALAAHLLKRLGAEPMEGRREAPAADGTEQTGALLESELAALNDLLAAAEQ